MRNLIGYLGAAVLAAVALPASLSVTLTDTDGDGDVDLADYAVFESCLMASDPSGPAACLGRADFDGDGDIDLNDFALLQTTFTGRRERALIPAKYVSLDQIGIHDAASGSYDGDCVACHGDRTSEVALDGKTGAAHSRMLEMIPYQGNERCLQCHGFGTDFLSGSAGGLRTQVNRDAVECITCHGRQAGDFSWYMQ